MYVLDLPLVMRILRFTPADSRGRGWFPAIYTVSSVWTDPQVAPFRWGSPGDLSVFAIMNNAIYIPAPVPGAHTEFLQGIHLREEGSAPEHACSALLSNAKLFSTVVVHNGLFSRLSSLSQIRGRLVLLITSKALNQQTGKLFLFAASLPQINSTPQ